MLNGEPILVTVPSNCDAGLPAVISDLSISTTAAAGAAVSLPQAASNSIETRVRTFILFIEITVCSP